MDSLHIIVMSLLPYPSGPATYFCFLVAISVETLTSPFLSGAMSADGWESSWAALQGLGNPFLALQGSVDPSTKPTPDEPPDASEVAGGSPIIIPLDLQSEGHSEERSLYQAASDWAGYEECEADGYDEWFE